MLGFQWAIFTKAYSSTWIIENHDSLRISSMVLQLILEIFFYTRMGHQCPVTTNSQSPLILKHQLQTLKFKTKFSQLERWVILEIFIAYHYVLQGQHNQVENYVCWKVRVWLRLACLLWGFACTTIGKQLLKVSCRW